MLAMPLAEEMHRYAKIILDPEGLQLRDCIIPGIPLQ
jgi:hypothetical protein